MEGGIPHGSGEQENEGALPLIFSVVFFCSCLCACEWFGFASWLGLAGDSLGLGAPRCPRGFWELLPSSAARVGSVPRTGFGL